MNSLVRTAILPALMLIAGPGPSALAQRDGVSDALSGHNAEMRQLAAPDPLRRAFFFDTVAVESPDAAVPCDHVAQRRPEVIAGPGTVVLLESTEKPGQLLRFWLPPTADQAADAPAAAAAFAQHVNFGPSRLVGVRRFQRCR